MKQKKTMLENNSPNFDIKHDIEIMKYLTQYDNYTQTYPRKCVNTYTYKQDKKHDVHKNTSLQIYTMTDEKQTYVHKSKTQVLTDTTSSTTKQHTTCRERSLR